MRFPCLPVLGLAVLLAGGLPCPSAFAADPGALLVNFADYRHDPDGTTMRPFEYAYGDWDKHVSAYRNQGTLVAAATGKGGMGDNHASLNLGGCPAVEMVLVVGNGNQAATLSLLLEDKDGTGHVWNLPLSDKPKGREVRYRLDLLKPDYVQAPGKTPGLNKSKIAVWQLRGDNESPRVEVLALKLVEAQ